MSATPSFSPPTRARDTVHPYASPTSRLQRSHSSAASKPGPIRTLSSISAHAMQQPSIPSTVPIRTPLPIAQDVRTPSPNYFGLAIDSSADVFTSSAAKHARTNWSPPTSNVRSTAAASPRVIPVEARPEYEAFRKQSENSKFLLGGLHNASQEAQQHNFRLNLPNSPVSPVHSAQFTSRPMRNPSSSSIHSPTKPRSPKRHLTSDSDVFQDRPRRNSPAGFTEDGTVDMSVPEDIRFSLPPGERPSLPNKTTAGQSFLQSHNRAETLPTKIDTEHESQEPTFVTPQHVVNLLDSSEDEILLLDLRVSTHFLSGRIVGSLNLCVPTTLLKRPSFNVAKLVETFKDDESKKKFQRWRSSTYIIVYDADTALMKDATVCVNTLKKFSNEGWTGCSYIIKGGFKAFGQKFNSYVVKSGASRASSVSSSDSGGPAIAPVIGGCPIPATQNAANPFFGNIRQNMDLIGGVGQMSLKRPAVMGKKTESNLPHWIKDAIDDHDEGKRVSDKFLHIEKREQRRMQEALSSNVTYGTPSPGAPNKTIKIAGIEKGSKNRYNNIWPYEHSRVKLENVSHGECDYINANYVHSSLSNKRYIATQGPIPATFSDFWGTVWDQDVRVIVMLTAEQEGGQVKAHNYWKSQDYGPLHLRFLSEHRASLEMSRIHKRKQRLSSENSVISPLSATSAKSPTNATEFPMFSNTAAAAHSTKTESPTNDRPYVIVRKFTLSHAEHPFERMREITQLQYSSWPDFGAPAHPAHLLGLVEQCDAVVRSTTDVKPSHPEPRGSRPIIVHCSAGCGRTGTFCTVDSVIDMLKKQRLERASSTPSAAKDKMEVDEEEALEPQDQGGFFSQGDAEKQEKVEKEEKQWLSRDDVDLIEKTVEEFRRQRLSMVQSLRQYVLCYETVLEWVVGETSTNGKS